MILETERLVLRTPEPGDARSLQDIASDPRVALTTGSIAHPYPADGAEKFILRIAADAQPQRLRLAITIRGDRRMIGLIGCHLLRPGRAEITYMVSPAFWNRGIATEAARRVIDHAFEVEKISTVVASTLVSNIASQRVLAKAGLSKLYERAVELPARGGVFPVSFWQRRNQDIG